MTLILNNRFVNGEVADAVPVDGNDQAIQSYINSEVITADGLTQMRAPLLLRAGDPTQPNHAANKDYVDAQMPIGTMLMWPAAVAPAGRWHVCDGSSLAASAYTVLFGLIGTKYGGSGGAFMLPNLLGRFPIGLDPSKTAFDTVGEAGGTFTVPVPAHAHPMPHGHVVSHTHEMPHTHTVNPASVVTTDAGAHSHAISYTPDATLTGGGTHIVNYVATGLHTSTDVEPAHHHSVDIPSTVTGQPDDATTDTSSIVNSGQPTISNTSNNTLALTSTDSVSATMIQPYLTVNFIIRII